MTVKATVQALGGRGEVIHSQLLPWYASAALGINAVSTTLLITWEEKGRAGTRRDVER